MAFQMPFIWPSVIVLPFLQFVRGRREEGGSPVLHWQGHMIAVLLQAPSTCTPGSPHNKRVLVFALRRRVGRTIKGRFEQQL